MKPFEFRVFFVRQLLIMHSIQIQFLTFANLCEYSDTLAGSYSVCRLHGEASLLHFDAGCSPFSFFAWLISPGVMLCKN